MSKEKKYRFGSNIINFEPKYKSDKGFVCCYVPILSFADETEFKKTNDKIVIGGKPLTLQRCKNNIPNPMSKDPSNPNYFYPYAIESIYINDILPIDPSNITISSFVLDGIRLLSLHGNNYKHYLNVKIIDYIPDVLDQTIFKGIPLCLGDNKELIFINSSYKEKDIDEYSSISIGGTPLSVGRVGNNWYLLVSEDYNTNSDWGN